MAATARPAGRTDRPECGNASLPVRARPLHWCGQPRERVPVGQPALALNVTQMVWSTSFGEEVQDELVELPGAFDWQDV